MINESVYDLIIIGSGPAGLTAAIYASRANLKVLIVAGELWGGQLMLTTEVENFPGFEEGIMGPELMEKMRKQALRFGAEWVEKRVTGVEFGKEPFEVMTDKSLVTGQSKSLGIGHSSLVEEKNQEAGQMTKSNLAAANDSMTNDKFFGRAVLVATGAEAMWLGVPGEAALIGRGISSCAPCDAAFFRNKRVLVVGGGDAAMEEALVLTKFASEVTLVHRRDAFRASQIMIDRVIAHPKIKVFWDSEIVEVKGEQKLGSVVIKTKGGRWETDKAVMLERGQGRVDENYKLQIKNDKQMTNDSMTNDELKSGDVFWEAKVDGMFVAVGHRPMTEIFKGQLELDEKGYLLKNSKLETRNSKLNEYHMMTSKEGVFVAGDVHDHHYRQAVTAAAFGCMAALEVERWLEEKK